MKKCPTCNRTFTDDALAFCLHDGSGLLSVGAGGEPQPDNLGATVQYNPGSASGPPSTPPYTPAPFTGQQAQQPSWAPGPPAGGMQGQAPPKKSRALFWILGIVGALVVLGIGGVVLVFVFVGMPWSNTNNSNEINTNTTSNSSANRSNDNNSNAREANTSTSSKVSIAKDDFSSTNWWVGSTTLGKSQYVNGQYHLTGGTVGGYVCVYGPKAYMTQKATTRLTVRSVSALDHPFGYGLAIFGELKDGQLDDYSFLIRTNENPAFRIVLHESGKETALADWTPASQIRTGTSTNQLEVRAGADTLDFYINGQLARSIAYSGKNSSGVVGVYTSGVSTIAFDDLEIYK